MKHLFIFICIAITFNSCKKTDRHYTGQPDIPEPYTDVMVTASVQGLVVDENKNPIPNALVKSGASIVYTNPKGYFFFDHILINKMTGTVTVDIPNHFKVTRTLTVQEGSVNFVTIQLMLKISKGSFQSGAGGTVPVEQGSSVKFDANSIVNVSGNSPYSGEVHLIAAYISPEHPEISSVMPGNLMALGPDNYLKQLQTFGMMAVEMRGSSGQTLALAPGKTATITMPIPSSILASAPATIPLWYFDDSTGLWKNEGTATKEGNMYVGKVAHFSFWNCDIPSEFVRLSMRFASHGGYSFPFYKVKLTNAQNGSFAFATTNSDGVAEGAVPANAKLIREIFNFCGEKIAADEIGPFSSSSDLGTTLLEIPSLSLVTITGTAKNCGGVRLTNGYADIFLDEHYYRAMIVDGNYSISIGRCNSTATTAYVSLTDSDAGQEGNPLPVPVTTGSYSVGESVACGFSVKEFIEVKLNDSIYYTFEPPQDVFESRFYATESMISASRKDQPRPNIRVFFYTDLIFPALTDLTGITFNNGDSLVMATGGPVTLDVSGPRHDFISGTVKVRLRDLDFIDHYEAEIRYKVRRN